MCVTPLRLRNNDIAVKRGYGFYREIPCGHCPECIKSRQDNWAERARRELLSFRPYYVKYDPIKHKNHDVSNMAFFFTFTYDDLRLPLRFNEDIPFVSLCYRHVTDFFHHFNKKRQRLGKNAISYLLCGEYGTRTHRPHYHAIVIGISLSECREMRAYWKRKHCPKSLSNDKLLYSDVFFNESITFSKANRFMPSNLQVGVVVSEISLDEASINGCSRYVSKYVVKGGDDWFKTCYQRDIIEKPKICVTKGFGLGYRYSCSYGKKSQSFAASAKVNKLLVDILRCYPSVSMYKHNGTCKCYNDDFIQLVNSRLLTESNGYLHTLPKFIYDKLFTPIKVIGYDKQKQKHEMRYYFVRPDVENGAEIPSHLPLLDALQLWRLKERSKRFRSLLCAWQDSHPKESYDEAFASVISSIECQERQKHYCNCKSIDDRFTRFYSKDKF